jgi:hypothetical protein
MKRKKCRRGQAGGGTEKRGGNSAPSIPQPAHLMQTTGALRFTDPPARDRATLAGVALARAARAHLRAETARAAGLARRATWWAERGSRHEAIAAALQGRKGRGRGSQ